MMSNGFFLDSQLQDYLDRLLPRTDGVLGEIQRRAYDEGMPIISGHVVAFLSSLLAAKRPCSVLEIGCGVGFSAGLFARFLSEGGQITTIERYDKMAEFAKINIERMQIADKIKIIQQDAADALPKLAENGRKFDFIFMDCGKSKYLNFLPYCMQMLTPGGILVVDDVLQNGTVSWEFEKIVKRQRTTYRNLREFLQAAMKAEGYFSSILPIGDGLLLCVKDL